MLHFSAVASTNNALPYDGVNAPKHAGTKIYEEWNFNSGKYLFTTDTK